MYVLLERNTLRQSLLSGTSFLPQKNVDIIIIFHLIRIKTEKSFKFAIIIFHFLYYCVHKVFFCIMYTYDDNGGGGKFQSQM